MFENTKLVKAIKNRVAFVGLSDSRLNQSLAIGAVGMINGGLFGLIDGNYALWAAIVGLAAFAAFVVMFKAYDFVFGGFMGNSWDSADYEGHTHERELSIADSSWHPVAEARYGKIHY